MKVAILGAAGVIPRLPRAAAGAPGDQTHGQGSDPGVHGPGRRSLTQLRVAPALQSAVCHQAGCGAPSPGTPGPREPQKSFRTIPPRTHSQSDVFHETLVDKPVGLGRKCRQGSCSPQDGRCFPSLSEWPGDSLRAQLLLAAGCRRESRLGSKQEGPRGYFCPNANSRRRL